MSKRVLIIDDETNIRRMMRLTLESDGYEVEDADDGAKGLSMFGNGERFDAVLLDQKMPGMDGISTLRQIRERAPSARVIMITAFGTIELAVDAMKLGATDFVRKPTTPDALRGALAAALSKTPVAPATRRAPTPSAAPLELPPVEVWTVNGFFIRARPAPEGAAANEHLFEIRHAARGPQGEVVVVVDLKEVTRLAKVIERELPVGGAFWRQRAERAVVNHFFREAAPPAGNRLVLNHISDDAIVLARSWTKD
ncbi:MAG: response regulator [Vicinamibacterales bacterium]|nr:response regulator [Vicinamibacterales bacterium]